MAGLQSTKNRALCCLTSSAQLPVSLGTGGDQAAPSDWILYKQSTRLRKLWACLLGSNCWQAVPLQARVLNHYSALCSCRQLYLRPACLPSSECASG